MTLPHGESSILSLTLAMKLFFELKGLEKTPTRFIPHTDVAPPTEQEQVCSISIKNNLQGQALKEKANSVINGIYWNNNLC